MHPSIPQTEAMFTITPVPRGAISRAAARVQKNVPSRCTASRRRHSSSLSRTSASNGVCTPPDSASSALRLEQRHDALQVGGADRSRVVDEDVDRAELTLDERERVVDRGAVADIGVQRQARADRRDRLPGGLQPHVERRDARAVGGEPVADRLADARASARDDGDPAVEAHAASGTATSRPRPWPAASRS